MLHLLRFGAHQRQVREWRESCGLPLVQLRLCERVVTTADQGFQQRMPGVMGLQPDLAGVTCAPGATGHLDQLLREFLAGAEVSGEQAFVDAHHHHQGQLRQVVALGQYLRADQDAGLVAQSRQLLFQCIAT